MPSLAQRTRDAVRRRPALRAALAAGAVNHTAAARLVADEVGATGDDVETVAAAVRRYGETLSLDRTDAGGSVRLVSGVGLATRETAASESRLLAVGDRAVVESAGDHTALVVAGVDADVDTTATLSTALARLDAEGVAVVAAGAHDDRAVVVVDRRDGADALRAVEDALGIVPRVED